MLFPCVLAFWRMGELRRTLLNRLARSMNGGAKTKQDSGELSKPLLSCQGWNPWWGWVLSPIMIGMWQDGFGTFRKIRSDFSVFTLAKTSFWKTHRASKRLDFFTHFYDTVFLKKYFCPFLLYTFSKNEKLSSRNSALLSLSMKMLGLMGRIAFFPLGCQEKGEILDDGFRIFQTFAWETEPMTRPQVPFLPN